MTESEARAAIVTYGALLWERGLVAGSSGNLSVRLGDGTLVVTPTQRSLRVLKVEELVRVDALGEPLVPQQRATSELPLHLAAYRKRPDVRCVVHTHPTYCVAWSKRGRLFPLDTVGAIESLGTIAFTRYAKSGTRELADICCAAFAEHYDTIVMERHGLSSVGNDFETAFLRTDLAEQTAHIEYAAALLAASEAGAAPADAEAWRMPNDPAPLPVERLRAAAAAHPEARPTIDALHAEVTGTAPSAERINEHVGRLRAMPDVVGTIEEWWLDPRTQLFFADLNSAGL